MTSNPTIRNATLRDVETVSMFLAPFIQAKQLLPRTQSEIGVLVTNGFVAECDEKIVGFAAVEIYSSKLAEIQCLAVASEYRRQGIGKLLIRSCVDVTREKGICELMAITAHDRVFLDCGFDYSLPNQKRAIFMQTKGR